VKKVLLGLGAAVAAAFAFGAYKPKKASAAEAEAEPEGVELDKGDQAVITATLRPMTVDQWRKIATDGGQMAQISANVFPQTGPVSVDSISPAPAPGVFTAVVTAKEDTVFVPSSQTVGEYTVTTIASRKA
jgi:hypothetical protein